MINRPFIFLIALCSAIATSVVGAQVETRDSAGVRIISYGSLTQGTRREPASLFVIHESSDCQFNRIRGMVLQQSGAIVIANFGNHELCLFGTDGRFVRRVGRKGGGPGEFQAPSGLWALRGDSLLTSDVLLRRLSIFAPDGEFVRSFSFKAPVDTLGSLSLVLGLSDGSVLLGFSEFVRGAPRPESVQFHQQLYRYGGDGTLLAQVGRAPIGEQFIQAVPKEMGGVAYWNRAFGRRLTAAATRDGFVAGDGTDFSIAEYDLHGQLRRIHRVRRSPQPVTSSDIAAYRERVLRGDTGPQRQITQRMVDEMPFPRTHPAYSRILVDRVGRIWVEAYSSTGTATGEWTVLDPTRTSSWKTLFPERFRLLAISAERACGVTRDADDVESVQCFALGF